MIICALLVDMLLMQVGFQSIK